MANIIFYPFNKQIEVRDGITVLEAARLAKVPLRTRCGGRAGCLMCKIKLDNTLHHPAPNDKELRKLGASTKEGIRLACQTKCKGSMHIFVPEDPLKAAIRKQLENQKEEQLDFE